MKRSLFMSAVSILVMFLAAMLTLSLWVGLFPGPLLGGNPALP